LAPEQADPHRTAAADLDAAGLGDLGSIKPPAERGRAMARCNLSSTTSLTYGHGFVERKALRNVAVTIMQQARATLASNRHI
jgi:hypothetical protein